MSKLTKRFVEAIIPDAEKTLKFWDSELKGLGVIILPSGRRTYCIEYRNADRIKKRIKIGVHGALTTEQARDLARKRLGQVAHGEDPAEAKKVAKDLVTVERLTQDYLEQHASRKRPKSLSEDKRLIKDVILPVFASMKVINIMRRDIEALHRKHEKTPYQANRVLALLSKMFSLAILWGLCEKNPVTGIQKYQEEKRDRWLNEEELNRLWSILDRYPQSSTAYAFKFLLLTGARKGECLNAQWDHFDFPWAGYKPSPLGGIALAVRSD